MKRKKAEKERKIKVTGIVIPADWDSNGKAIAFAVSTFNEKEYLVRYIDDKRDLEHFLGKKVFVEGTLFQSESLKVIYIQTIGLV